MDPPFGKSHLSKGNTHRILSLLHDTLDISQLPQNSSFLKPQKCQRTVTQNYFYSCKSAFFQNLKQLQVNRISNICSEQSSTLCSPCPLPKTEAKCSYFSHHSSQAKDTGALQTANSSTHMTHLHNRAGYPAQKHLPSAERFHSTCTFLHVH